MTMEADNGDEIDGCAAKDWSRYAIEEIPWRAQQATKWLRAIDHVHLFMHFKDNRRATPGAFSRHYILSHCIEHNVAPIKGLLYNFYNVAWLETLTESEVKELGMWSDLDISHAPAIQW